MFQRQLFEATRTYWSTTGRSPSLRLRGLEAVRETQSVTLGDRHTICSARIEYIPALTIGQAVGQTALRLDDDGRTAAAIPRVNQTPSKARHDASPFCELWSALNEKQPRKMLRGAERTLSGFFAEHKGGERGETVALIGAV